MILIINDFEFEILDITFKDNRKTFYYSSIITYDSVIFEMSKNSKTLQKIHNLVDTKIKNITIFSENKFFNGFNCIITNIESKNNLIITLSFEYYDFNENISLLRKYKIKKLL